MGVCRQHSNSSRRQSENRAQAMNFKVLTEDAQFQTELNQAGAKLVIADFTSARCGPCQRIAPLFQDMASRFPNGVFLKIDVNQCPGAAQSQGVSATPTFIFYRNKTKLDSLQGADPEALEARIRQHYGDPDADSGEDCGVAGHMDLLPMISKNGCECLNESDDNTYQNCLSSTGGFLESDTDEQLILYLAFNQNIKLHSMRLKAPADCGPKQIKIFVNQPHTLDFDTAESATALQEFTLTPKELEGELITLKYVKLQNVANITVFVFNNQTDQETTKINYLQLIGSPVQTTNMSDFKRVAGKKGETHA